MNIPRKVAILILNKPDLILNCTVVDIKKKAAAIRSMAKTNACGKSDIKVISVENKNFFIELIDKDTFIKDFALHSAGGAGGVCVVLRHPEIELEMGKNFRAITRISPDTLYTALTSCGKCINNKICAGNFHLNLGSSSSFYKTNIDLIPADNIDEDTRRELLVQEKFEINKSTKVFKPGVLYVNKKTKNGYIYLGQMKNLIIGKGRQQYYSFNGLSGKFELADYRHIFLKWEFLNRNYGYYGNCVSHSNDLIEKSKGKTIEEALEFLLTKGIIPFLESLLFCPPDTSISEFPLVEIEQYYVNSDNIDISNKIKKNIISYITNNQNGSNLEISILVPEQLKIDSNLRTKLVKSFLLSFKNYLPGKNSYLLTKFSNVEKDFLELFKCDKSSSDEYWFLNSSKTYFDILNIIMPETQEQKDKVFEQILNETYSKS